MPLRAIVPSVASEEEQDIYDAIQTFESLNKNLRTYSATLSYSGSDLTSVVYDIGGGQNITKTLNYTNGDLTSVVISGTVPSWLSITTKTLSYTNGDLTGVSYS